ncbi:MAG: hypothetical protein RCG16_05185 [Rickettsia hoogstraalii]
MLAGIKEFFEIESDEVLYDKLTKAIKEKNTIEAKKLIEKIENTELFNKANAYHNTLLHSGIEQGLKEISDILISKMSNEAINIIEKHILSGEQKGETYLTLLASKGFGKACETLIPRMSDEAINIIDNKHKDSALKKVIRNDMDEVAQMLIPRTSDDNIYVIDRYSGNTLLITAAKKGMKTVCKMLISRMPLELINHINNAGYTAASVAAASIASKDTENFKEVFDLLQEKQEEFLKIITITKQNIENSLKDLESAENN